MTLMNMFLQCPILQDAALGKESTLPSFITKSFINCKKGALKSKLRGSYFTNKTTKARIIILTWQNHNTQLLSQKRHASDSGRIS